MNSPEKLYLEDLRVGDSVATEIYDWIFSIETYYWGGGGARELPATRADLHFKSAQNARALLGHSAINSIRFTTSCSCDVSRRIVLLRRRNRSLSLSRRGDGTNLSNRSNLVSTLCHLSTRNSATPRRDVLRRRDSTFPSVIYPAN